MHGSSTQAHNTPKARENKRCTEMYGLPRASVAVFVSHIRAELPSLTRHAHDSMPHFVIPRVVGTFGTMPCHVFCFFLRLLAEQCHPDMSLAVPSHATYARHTGGQTHRLTATHGPADTGQHTHTTQHHVCNRLQQVARLRTKQAAWRQYNNRRGSGYTQGRLRGCHVTERSRSAAQHL